VSKPLARMHDGAFNPPRGRRSGEATAPYAEVGSE
jgi:hypothetical protein